MHNQLIEVRIRYNHETKELEVSEVLAAPRGESLEPVFVEPNQSASFAERFWTVLKLGGRSIVVCEVPCD